MLLHPAHKTWHAFARLGLVADLEGSLPHQCARKVGIQVPHILPQFILVFDKGSLLRQGGCRMRLGVVRANKLLVQSAAHHNDVSRGSMFPILSRQNMNCKRRPITSSVVVQERTMRARCCLEQRVVKRVRGSFWGCFASRSRPPRLHCALYSPPCHPAQTQLS